VGAPEPETPRPAMVVAGITGGSGRYRVLGGGTGFEAPPATFVAVFGEEEAKVPEDGA
jgi:hypothetical protein